MSAAYVVESIPVPDVDTKAGVRMRWKLTHSRTGTVEVVALLRGDGAPNLACTCGLAFCNHRQEVLQLIAPSLPPDDGAGQRRVA